RVAPGVEHQCEIAVLVRNRCLTCDLPVRNACNARPGDRRAQRVEDPAVKREARRLGTGWTGNNAGTSGEEQQQSAESHEAYLACCARAAHSVQCTESD